MIKAVICDLGQVDPTFSSLDGVLDYPRSLFKKS
jgi:hypothetical protein